MRTLVGHLCSFLLQESQSLIIDTQERKLSPPLVFPIRLVDQLHTYLVHRRHPLMYQVPSAPQYLHPRLRLRSHGVVVSSQIGPHLKSANVSSRGGLCLVKNAQIRGAMGSHWFGLPMSEVTRITERFVVLSIPILPFSTNLKECVICGTVYITEVDWAGREHLVPADPRTTNTSDSSNSHHNDKVHVQGETQHVCPWIVPHFSD